MQRARIALLCVAVSLGWASTGAAQFAAGDRCLVVVDGAEVCRMQTVVDKLDKGKIVVARAVQPASDGHWIKIDRDKGEYGWVHEDNLSRDGLVGIRLDDVRKSVAIKEDLPIKMAAGTSKVVEETIRVRHTVSLPRRWKAGSPTQLSQIAGVVAKCEADIRGEIEKSTGQQFGAESERKRSVTIQGGAPKSVKVVWLEYYRTGNATLLVSGEEIQAPFEFREDFGLVTNEVDASPQSFEVTETPPPKSEPPKIEPAKSEPANNVAASRRDPRSFSWPEVALAFVVGAIIAFSIGRIPFRKKRPTTDPAIQSTPEAGS